MPRDVFTCQRSMTPLHKAPRGTNKRCDGSCESLCVSRVAPDPRCRTEIGKAIGAMSRQRITWRLVTDLGTGIHTLSNVARGLPKYAYPHAFLQKGMICRARPVSHPSFCLTDPGSAEALCQVFEKKRVCDSSLSLWWLSVREGGLLWDGAQTGPVQSDPSLDPTVHPFGSDPCQAQGTTPVVPVKGSDPGHPQG